MIPRYPFIIKIFNRSILIALQVREFLEPSGLGSGSSIGGSGLRSASRQRSGMVTPDSELADEEVDRLGQSNETLGDGERALVHAMCNVMNLLFIFFNFI